MHNYDEPVYLISVVSKILSIHPQTLRQYEREGLITPSRTDGRIRLYSQRDIDKIKTILRLTRDLGVNLAGVDIILRMKEKISQLEYQVDELNMEVMKYKYNKSDSSDSNLEQNKLVNKSDMYELTVSNNQKDEFDFQDEKINEELDAIEDNSKNKKTQKKSSTRVSKSKNISEI
jgi:MerR family transcriptional regulator/heat shock protein HspR